MDSDDEDPETVETRKSLKTAEAKLKTRFFTNMTDEKKYNEMKKKGELRKEVEDFKEKDDHDVTLSKGEVAVKEADKAQGKAKAELDGLTKEAKKTGEKEFLDEKIKKDLDETKKQQEVDDKKQTKEAEPASAAQRNEPSDDFVQVWRI